MGIGDGFAHLQEEFQFRPQGEFGAIDIDRLSVDVLHDEEGAAIFGMPRVQEVSDAFVAERGQDLAFAKKTFLELWRIRAESKELDGNGVLHFAVDAFGQIDVSHAATTEMALQPERAESHVIRSLANPCLSSRCYAPDEGRVCGSVMFKQRFHLASQFVRNLAAKEELRSRIGCKATNLVEDVLDFKAHRIGPGKGNPSRSMMPPFPVQMRKRERVVYPSLVEGGVLEDNAQVTIWLQQMKAGDAVAGELLASKVYEELRSMAKLHLRSERPGHTLQPTALLHEAFVKVFARNPDFTDRTHFMATMAMTMRRILVDYARTRNSARRGGQQLVRLGPEEEAGEEAADAEDMLTLNAALDALALTKEQAARFVEMHYFGGMTAVEIAEVTGVSVHMVRQRLRYAQAWLRSRMAANGEG